MKQDITVKQGRLTSSLEIDRRLRQKKKGNLYAQGGRKLHRSEKWENMTPAERTNIIEDLKNKNQNGKKIRRTKVNQKMEKRSKLNDEETCKTKKERVNSDTE